jgi:hypothetical protein
MPQPAQQRLTHISGSSPASVGHEGRLGSGGHRPPTLSMARAISASGDLKPNATRVSRRILVLTDSTSPLDSPWVRAAWMAARCLVIARASRTKAGIRQRPGQPRLQQHRRPRALEPKRQPKLLLQQAGAVQTIVDLGDPGKLAPLPAGQVLWVLPQRIPGALELPSQPRLATPFTSRRHDRDQGPERNHTSTP